MLPNPACSIGMIERILLHKRSGFSERSVTEPQAFQPEDWLLGVLQTSIITSSSVFSFYHKYRFLNISQYFLHRNIFEIAGGSIFSRRNSSFLVYWFLRKLK